MALFIITASNWYLFKTTIHYFMESLERRIIARAYTIPVSVPVLSFLNAFCDFFFLPNSVPDSVKQPIPNNEPKTNHWSNKTAQDQFWDKFIIPEDSNEQVKQCCSNCVKTENSGISSAEEAFDAKDFEDYLLDEVLVKKSNSRTKRDADSVDNNTIASTITTTVPPTTTEKPEANVTVKIIEVNGSLERKSFVFTNLTHFTDYEISVRACLSPSLTIPGLEPPYCSVVKNSKIHAITNPIVENDRLRNYSLYTEKSNDSKPIYFVSWNDPANPNGAILAYQVEKRLTGKTEGAGVTNLACLTRSEFLGNGSRHRLEFSFSGDWEVRVRARSSSGFGEWTSPENVYIDDESRTGLLWYLLLAFILLAFTAISASTSWYIFKKTQSNPPHIMEYVSMNPEYVSVYVPDDWEIDRGKTALIRELGQGSFGMVYEGHVIGLKEADKPYPCAIKTVNDHASATDKVQFLNEASVMK